MKQARVYYCGKTSNMHCDTMDLVFLDPQKRRTVLSSAGMYNCREHLERALTAIDSNIPNYRRIVGTLCDIIGPSAPLNILDVGCGMARDLIELAGMGHRCAGLNAVPQEVKWVNDVGAKLGINVTAQQGDACNMPYESESFDVVMSTNFFEHVYDFERALHEQIRVLKRDGRLIIRDGNILCPPLLYDLLFSYPRRTNGKRGGFRWLCNKTQVIEDYFEGGCPGKDEDVKTLWWWKKMLNKESAIKPLLVTTTGAFKDKHRWYSKVLSPFYGAILIVARKM